MIHTASMSDSSATGRAAPISEAAFVGRRNGRYGRASPHRRGDDGRFSGVAIDSLQPSL
jgi:hypothetical protein